MKKFEDTVRNSFLQNNSVKFFKSQIVARFQIINFNTLLLFSNLLKLYFDKIPTASVDFSKL